MVFTKDTTFLNLVRGERDHENYGISHTIRHWFVMRQREIFSWVVINLNVGLAEI